jgi:hypothetical protein
MKSEEFIVPLTALVGLVIVVAARMCGRAVAPSDLPPNLGLQALATPGLAPGLPSPNAPSPQTFRVLEITAPSVVITPNTHYLAKIQLTGLESLLGDPKAVAGKLTEMGFTGVSVVNKNPPPLFPDQAPYKDGSTFWASGTSGPKAESLTLPNQIKKVWVVA